MTDEEKKAIEYWQYIRDTQIYDGYKGQVYAVELLSLIEKQSKEIEELKEKNKTLKSLQNDTNGLYIEMTERKNYFERELQKVEDKIKAKIEEYDDEINQLRIDRNVTFDSLIYRNSIKKDALQELLDKE